MSKQLKGVITAWNMYGNRIYGTCVKHTEYGNGIADGEPITTSDVVAIYKIDHSDARLCETKNSIYVLV